MDCHKNLWHLVAKWHAMSSSHGTKTWELWWLQDDNFHKNQSACQHTTSQKPRILQMKQRSKKIQNQNCKLERNLINYEA